MNDKNIPNTQKISFFNNLFNPAKVSRNGIQKLILIGQYTAIKKIVKSKSIIPGDLRQTGNGKAYFGRISGDLSITVDGRSQAIWALKG